MYEVSRLVEGGVKVETLIERPRIVRCGGLARVEREEISRTVMCSKEDGE